MKLVIHRINEKLIIINWDHFENVKLIKQILRKHFSMCDPGRYEAFMQIV